MPDRLRLDSGFFESFDAELSFISNYKMQEKVRYEQEVQRINEAKKIFIESLLIAYRDIEENTRNIADCIQNREKELKGLLQKFRCKRILEWNRQLQLCRQANKIIDSIHDTSLQAFDTILTVHNFFAMKIDLIDAGYVHFRPNITPSAYELENFGRLSCGSGSEESSEKVNPKLVMPGGLNEKGKFSEPWGVCSDKTGQIFIVDNESNKVLVFSEYGEFLFNFGESGSGPGQFTSPAGIATDEKCQIILCDKDNHRIQIFTFTGKFLVAFGKRGTEPGEFQYPYDVAVGEDGSLVVSDSGNSRIQLLNSHGCFITQFHFTKNLLTLSKQVCPCGIAFRPDGTLLVVDHNNCCVLSVDKRFSKVTLCEYKGIGFSKPYGVACNSKGMFAVAYRNKVQVFDPLGKLSKSLEYEDLHRFGGQGRYPEELNYLQGICFLPDGSIIVADVKNRRVVMFGYSYVGFEIRQFPQIAVASAENDEEVQPESSKAGWKQLKNKWGNVFAKKKKELVNKSKKSTVLFTDSSSSAV